MGPQQHQQPQSATDAASLQRQMLTWQMQQLRPVRPQPLQLQLPYTSRDNPVAQQDTYRDAQVNAACFKFGAKGPIKSGSQPG